MPSPSPELKPDLTVTALWVNGEDINFRVKNIGDAKAQLSYIGIYINDDYKACIMVYYLKPNRVIGGIFSSGIILYDIENGDEIRLSADYQNDIDESNEQNNDLTIIHSG